MRAINRPKDSETGDLRAEVDELSKPLVGSEHMPGIIVVVLTSNGDQLFFPYAIADKSTGEKLSASTLFPTGSLSKRLEGPLYNFKGLLIDPWGLTVNVNSDITK